MEYMLSERMGKLIIEKIGENITLKLWYETKFPNSEPHQRIPILPEELDKLCEWWKKAK